MSEIRTKQCQKCPWHVDVDPNEIPNGYCPTKHKNLDSTIATHGGYSTAFSGSLPMMACHESKVGKEVPCVGWLANQLGPGNNIGLRLWARGKIKKPLELVGEQHERFEDTLPEEL